MSAGVGRGRSDDPTMMVGLLTPAWRVWAETLAGVAALDVLERQRARHDVEALAARAEAWRAACECARKVAEIGDPLSLLAATVRLEALIERARLSPVRVPREVPIGVGERVVLTWRKGAEEAG